MSIPYDEAHARLLSGKSCYVKIEWPPGEFHSGLLTRITPLGQGQRGFARVVVSPHSPLVGVPGSHSEPADVDDIRAGAAPGYVAIACMLNILTWVVATPVKPAPKCACGSPAVLLFTSIECSNVACRHYKESP